MSALRLLSAFVLLVVPFITQSAVEFYVSEVGIYSTEVSGATTIDFNDYSCGSAVSCSGNGQIVSGSLSGRYASPFGIDSAYLSVPQNGGSGSVSLGLDGAYNYYGLYWGSIDNYNSIDFYLEGTWVGGFGGADLGPLSADGGQGSWNSNRFINFMFSGGDLFDMVMLSSDGYAFESDNHAYANVPEPPVFVVLAVGLAGLLVTRRHLANR